MRWRIPAVFVLLMSLAASGRAQDCQAICNEYVNYARGAGMMSTLGPLEQLYNACMACSQGAFHPVQCPSGLYPAPRQNHPGNLICITPGSVDCGTHYCDPGSQCTSNGGGAPEGSVDCGSYYCNPGNVCMRSVPRGCRPIDSTDCGNGTVCSAGSICSRGGGCVPINTVDCGNGRYCNEGDQCAPNGQHCVTKTVNCGSYSCNQGMKCASGNRCIAEGEQDCGNGRSCSSPYVCYRGGIECLTQSDIEDRRLKETIARLAGINPDTQAGAPSGDMQGRNSIAPPILPSGPVGQMDKAPDLLSSKTNPVKRPEVFEALAAPSAVKGSGQPPKDLATVPNSEGLQAGVVATTEILGAVKAGKTTALKWGAKAGDAMGIYGDAADAWKTMTDVAQKKGTVTVAHDVEDDMWDIINTASPLGKVKGMSSVGMGVVEKKGTEAVEGYLTDVIYENFYKPR